MTESIKSLHLEAIFYPKFDNEKQQQENQGSSSIRSAMLNALDENESRTGDLTAVVEVSLKHSGSLLLWSGADRYYAKNSMDNIFTLTGELLLRQHFARVFQSTHGMSSSDSEGTMSSSSTDGGNKRKFDECVGENEHMYLSCSQEVQKRRLCLAFEMVTAMLGDHGDIPKRDYLILTAVADLKKKQFYSTIDLVEFAQRWRLPHNDVWLFRTRSSTESVFSLYDNLRETGLATTVVEKLNQITQDNLESEHAIYMKSMYPHIHFQGDILEGLVMRLVMQSSSGIQLSQTLSFKSKEILEMIPPEKTSYSKNNLNERTKDYPSACLCTDLRGLFIDAEKNTDKVEKMLRDLLKNERLVTSTQNSTVAFEFNLVREVNSFINRFTNGSSDSESYKIAHLIQNLSLMNAPVDFKSNYVSHGSGKGQIISTIHVKADHVFPSYYKKKKEQDLDLYRGFFIRVNDKCEDDIDQANFFNKFKQETISFKEPMMLKMKFLPYMVRTFIIRNGLGILRKQGEQPFMQYASTQLKKWNMSTNAQHKWMPLFRKWTKYAMPLLRLDPPSITSQSYLSHFLNFFSEVEFSHLEVKEGCNKSIFKALVMVVGVSPIVKLLSEHISSVIGAHHIKALKKLTPEKAAYARSVTGNGLVCACEIQEGVGKVRRLLPKYQNCIYVLFVGCSENEISASCASYGSKEKKKVKGMLKAWKETKFARTEYVSENSFFNLIPFKSDGNVNQSLSSVSDIVEKLWKFSSTLAVKDEEPGVLIFFPSIPGAGKSSISSLSSNDICDIQNVHGGHRVLNLCSDDIKGKFWPQIRQEKLDDTSTILLADKNAPPNAWETIHSICTGSHNMAIPILPDGAGLSTLKVQGDSSHIQCKQLSDSKREPVNHLYPFPLHYLAVCISRVLMREEGSHVGRLDRSTKNACMIVVKFLSFYRNYTVERLLDEVPCHSTIFRVPFFNNASLPPLPNSLHDALIDALRLQVSAAFNRPMMFNNKLRLTCLYYWY